MNMKSELPTSYSVSAEIEMEFPFQYLAFRSGRITYLCLGLQRENLLQIQSAAGNPIS